MSAVTSHVRLFDPTAHVGGAVTLREVCEDRLAHLALRAAAENLTAEKLGHHRVTLSQLTGWIDPLNSIGLPQGDLPADALTQEVFTRWVLAHLQSWPSGHTRRDKIGYVRAAVEHGREALGLDLPLLRRPKHIKCPLIPRHHMRAEHYTAIMRQAMARTMDRRHRGSLALRRGLYFCWRTGCRPQTMRELEPHHISWPEKIIRVEDHKTRHLTNEDQLIAFDAGVERLLRRLVARMRPGQRYVFVSDRGRPWDRHTWNRHLKRYAAAAGVPPRVTAYSSRHGYAVKGVLAGTDRKVLADLMGHADCRMIETVYAAATRRDGEHLARAAAATSSARRKRQPKPIAEAPAPTAAEIARREAEQYPLFADLD